MGYSLRRWVLAYVVGLRPSPSLGSGLHRWAMPFSVVGLYPSPSLGCALRRWVVPFPVVGLCPWLYPTPLGYALRRWAVPYAVGLYPTPLGCCALRRWVGPYVLGLCPSPLGYALRRWALSLWHLLSRRGGPSSSPLFPEAGIVGERSSVGWNERRNEENEPRHSSWFVFMTHYVGLPHPGSPLMFLPSPFLHRANLSRPHPSGKGRGGCSGVRVLTF